MRTFTVTVGYNVCYVHEVTVRAPAAAQACERAIAVANRTAEGWRATDGASESYVEAIEAVGRAVAVPEQFAEIGILVPEVITVRSGLEEVIRIGESGLAAADAADTVRRLVAQARAVLAKARQHVPTEPGGMQRANRCETCGGRGRLKNPGDYLGTETCPTCTGTGRAA